MKKSLKQINFIVFIAVLTVLIFLLDLITPVEWAVWLFYIIPLFLVSRVSGVKFIYRFTGICSALMVAGYFIPPAPLSPVSKEITLFNTGMGLLMLWLTAFLLVRYKKADEAAREMDAKFRSMVEDSSLPNFMVQDGRLVYYNPRLRELFGYSDTELGKMDFLNLIRPDDHSTVNEMLSKLYGGEIKKIANEVEGMKKSGERLSIQIIGSYTMFNNKPAVIGAMVDLSWAMLTSALFKPL